MVSLKYSGKGLDSEPRDVGSSAGFAFPSCVALASLTIAVWLVFFIFTDERMGSPMEDPPGSFQL